MGEKSKEVKNFRDLGVCEQLVKACEIRGWLVPSKIQSEAIPHALEGRDVIGLAETGSGKTGAFALPIIQALLENPQPFFACVLSPTRELALQISDEFKALGSGIGLKCSVLFGGVDMMEQAISLAKRPHVVVFQDMWQIMPPGALFSSFYAENIIIIEYFLRTIEVGIGSGGDSWASFGSFIKYKRFQPSHVKIFGGRIIHKLPKHQFYARVNGLAVGSKRTSRLVVLDEADGLLSMEFEKVIDDILKALPGDRRTFLFSATMTKKVGKLQRACLKNPVKVEASAKYSTVDTCEQKFRLVPAKDFNLCKSRLHINSLICAPLMDKLLAKADKEVLVEAVKFIQKQGMKGVKGGWTEFLDSHDKQFGSCLSDPRKRSVDVLVAFLETFTQGKDRMLITKILTRHNDHEAIKQFIKEFPDQETLQQRLVKMTVEHSKYTQNYSFPSHEEDWLVLPLGKISNSMKSKKAIAVDCEMVLCEDGTDGVVRVCAVNQDLEVKLDKVVNPNKAIVDYRTEFTGITAKDLEGVTYSLDDVQKSLKKLLSNGTILVGHSLHNDLKVLKIDYPRVIDTSYIFNIKDVPTSYTPSLNNLCKSILGYEIRKEGEPHNCLVDSQAAMKLLLAKMEHGYDEPITIARKTVQNTDLPKLLLHKVPVEVPCQTLHIAFPTQYTVEIQDPKIRGQSYSTFAVFKDAREADTAYTDIDGKESTDSMGRPQKQVTLNLNTGQTVSFFVRRMISVSVLNRESKKRSAIDDGIEDSRRQKMCLQECEHVKEIERLKQEIRNREGEVFNLQKILAALTRKHGL